MVTEPVDDSDGAPVRDEMNPQPDKPYEPPTDPDQPEDKQQEGNEDDGSNST